MLSIMTAGVMAANVFGQHADKTFTESLMQDTCDFVATGSNTYFILEPG